MDEDTETAATLFGEAIDWLQQHYDEFEFWVERDLVWTVQTRLRQLISERRLPYGVFNDYPLLPGARRARSADLVIRDASKTVLVAAEFKYEPSHRRSEFLALPGKLPVVFWGNDGVAKDIERIREFVERGAAQAAFAVFVDEGRASRHRPPHPGTAWRDWPPPAQVPTKFRSFGLGCHRPDVLGSGRSSDRTPRRPPARPARIAAPRCHPRDSPSPGPGARVQPEDRMGDHDAQALIGRTDGSQLRPVADR